MKFGEVPNLDNAVMVAKRRRTDCMAPMAMPCLHEDQCVMYLRFDEFRTYRRKKRQAEKARARRTSRGGDIGLVRMSRTRHLKVGAQNLTMHEYWQQ